MKCCGVELEIQEYWGTALYFYVVCPECQKSSSVKVVHSRVYTLDQHRTSGINLLADRGNTGCTYITCPYPGDFG